MDWVEGFGRRGDEVLGLGTFLLLGYQMTAGR